MLGARSRTRLGRAAAKLLGLVTFTWLVAVAPSWAQRSPAPLDPLTPEELTRAADTARADSSVQSWRGGGRWVLGAIHWLPPAKPSDELSRDPATALEGRFAVALLCRYADYSGLAALIDLSANRLLETTEISCDEVPISAEELAEVRNLAVAHPEVRSLLGGMADSYQVRLDAAAPPPVLEVQAVKLFGYEESDPCFRQRCYSALFAQPEGYLSGWDVVVNLTQGTVSVLPIPEPEATALHNHGRAKQLATRRASARKAAGGGQ